jgi:plasmid stability protein
MAQLLVRGLEPDVIERWKERARRNNRSLEAEIRDLLKSQAGPTQREFEDAVRFADEMRRKLAGKIRGDSTDIIRRARDSR